jgi:hypothetical protein
MANTIKPFFTRFRIMVWYDLFLKASSLCPLVKRIEGFLSVFFPDPSGMKRHPVT